VVTVKLPLKQAIAELAFFFNDSDSEQYIKMQLLNWEIILNGQV